MTFRTKLSVTVPLACARMVKNSIKIYARLKKEKGKKKLANYVITRSVDEYEDIVFPHKQCAPGRNNNYQKYRFRRIFDQESGQSEVFDIVAKPIINSVINGFNGTVLAYGQTGSGKTFAITGSGTKYEDRGIIPRSIQQIFESINCSGDHFTVYISYLEIYQEGGYDLLNPNQQPSFLEELPRVVLLEDAHGKAHLRNLSVLPVANEQEALRLLLLGDTNRIIAETPMNEHSSRSHCIFTIYITTRSDVPGKIRRSKLHLVDLAGSERINKSNISGIALNEAKHINLSLHYLEQVIFALSQPNRSHIPFRNSMMTYILRDSLSGNSSTVLLATLAITQNNLEETIATCKFTQRVACISTEAIINEEIDPQEEIIFLRNELEKLRRGLTSTIGTNTNEELTLEQEARCKKAVKNYLRGSSDVGIDLDVKQIKLCFTLFKEHIKKRERSRENATHVNAEVMDKYMHIIIEKDKEISMLKELLDVKPKCQEEKREVIFHGEKQNTIRQSIEKQALEVFTMDRNNKKEFCSIQNDLDQKYVIARRIAFTIQKCQSTIVDIRKKLKANTYNPEIAEQLKSFLISQQNVYRESILQLQALKNETDYLNRAKIRNFHRFKDPENNISENVQNKIVPKKDASNSTEDCNNFINQVLLNTSENNFEVIKEVKNSSNDYCDFSLCDVSDKQNLDNFESKRAELDEHINKLNSISESFNMNTARKNPVKYSVIPSRNTLIQQPYNKPSFEEKVTNVSYCKFLNNTREKNNVFENCAAKEFINAALDVRTKGLLDIKSAQKDLEKTPIREKGTLKMKDSAEFIEFMKTVPLTGDADVDDEIFNFYRKKLKLKT